MSYTRLRYHLIFATKNRAHWITPEVEAFLYPVLGRLTKSLGGKSIRIGGVEDHVHQILALPPSHNINDFVRALKAKSSGALRRNFSHLSEFRWQYQFGCFTLNPLDLDAIIAYVDNQKQHHRDRVLVEPWERVDE